MAEHRNHTLDAPAHLAALAALAEAVGIVILAALDTRSTRQRLAERGLDASVLTDDQVLDAIKDVAHAEGGCLLVTESELEGQVDRALADALNGGPTYIATFEAREWIDGQPELVWADVQWPVHLDEITDLDDSFEPLRHSRHAPPCVREWQGPCVVTLNGCDTPDELRREEREEQELRAGGGVRARSRAP